ncbi:MAG TPA: type II secretion system F family protein [Euzebya sp.]|nr:type II secretion system F family protein [Euzebya sp.]
MTTQDLTPNDLLVVQAMLAAGAAPQDALGEVSCPALTPIRGALQAGVALPAIAGGLRHPPERRWWRGPRAATHCLPPASAALVRAMAVAEVVGAPAGPAVQRVLDGVRDAVRLHDLIRIRSAQAVVSARFLIGLPLVAAAGMALLDPAARRFLTSPLGTAVAALAGVLIASAAMWIHRLLAGIAGAGSRADPLVATGEGRDPVPAVAVGTGVVAAIGAGPIVGLVAGVVLLLGGPSVIRRLRRPRGRGTEPGHDATERAARVSPAVPGALPTVEAIELMALAMSAGVGLTEACRIVARLGSLEVRPALGDIAARLASGTPPAHAFPAQLSELAHLIDLTHRWGAPTAEALRLLAGDIRCRAATAAEEAAERLTVQLVFPTTVLLVPAFGLLVVAPLVASSLSGVGLAR